MALAERRQDATEARLAGPDASGGRLVRRGAPRRRARLRAMGLPQRRDEYWKYTRPDALLEPEAPSAALLASDEAPSFDAIDRLKIVFVDGVFDAEASDELELEGVAIERLAETGGSDIHWAKDIYGVLEARGQTPVARPFAALNTAFATRRAC